MESSFAGGEVDEAVSLYEEIIRELECHPNARRIKKLLYAAYMDVWENDWEKLAAYELGVLVQELFQAYPSLSLLGSRLHSYAQTLNKPGEYALVAETILAYLVRLEEEMLPKAIDTITKPLKDGEIPGTDAPSTSTQLETEAPPVFDPFTLRHEVMLYTTPLRAKFLSYAMLEEEKPDESLLLSLELDDLLARLLEKYPRLTDLEAALSSVAAKFDTEDDIEQAAGAIAQAFKPFYK